MNLGSHNLLLHATRRCPEAVSMMRWPLSFKATDQRYNSLGIDEDGNTTEQKLSGVEFHIFPTDYHTWYCPIFFLDSPLKVVQTGIPK